MTEHEKTLPPHPFSQRLLNWYDEFGRELPWRNTRDPYRIWISEIILQQTRVAQGYDYYLRFIDRFPTVEILAAASQDEVMRQWEGLGYYSRARNLHTAAQQIVEQGGFPTDYEEVKNLKAIRNTKYRSLIPGLIITPIINTFIEQFGDISSHALFQLRLAKWQCEHCNYTAAYISVIESIITYACEINHKPWEDYETREEAKKALRKNTSSWKIDAGLTDIFRKANSVRNSLAHSLETDKKPMRMIDLLKEYLNTLTTIIK